MSKKQKRNKKKRLPVKQIIEIVTSIVMAVSALGLLILELLKQ